MSPNTISTLNVATSKQQLHKQYNISILLFKHVNLNLNALLSNEKGNDIVLICRILYFSLVKHRRKLYITRLILVMVNRDTPFEISNIAQWRSYKLVTAMWYLMFLFKANLTCFDHCESILEFPVLFLIWFTRCHKTFYDLTLHAMLKLATGESTLCGEKNTEENNDVVITVIKPVCKFTRVP